MISPPVGAHLHRVAGGELAGEEFLRQRVLDLLLDRALQRPRAVDRIEARRRDRLQRGVRSPYSRISSFASRASSAFSWIFAISAICASPSGWNTTISSIRFTNSGRKLALTSASTAILISASSVARVGHLLDLVRAQVRRHDDHGVLEVDRAALAVGHPAVVQHLQQHVEHVRVRLLDLVQQDHAVGLAAHELGQVAALLVADVARRRADQPRDRVPLLELGHVDADQMLLGVEQEFGERLAELGLAHARRAEEQERAVRAVGVGRAPSASGGSRPATRRTASSWPTTRRCSASSMCRSLSRSPCIIFDTGMPVARDTTSAISSAPTCVRRSCGFFASSFVASCPPS